jgi:hypothetical protein
MADNIELNTGSGGSTLATAEVTFSGDTADVQVVGLGLITGSAESYAVQLVAGGAGAVGATVQRVTLASDDPAVVDLAAIEVDLTSIDGKITACDTGAVVLASGTVTTVTSITNDVNIADGGNSITVDWAGTAPPIGACVEATALRVTIATDSTGVLSVDDGGGTITVDGTVTANLSATDNAVLDQIDSNTDYGAVVGGGVEATALRVTLANDSTGTLTVDTTGTSGLEVVQGTAADLNVTEASASAILTAVQLIDNTVAVLGTATYSEASTSGNVVGAVRNDELATLADTDNEIAPLQVDEDGALMVSETSVACKRASGVAATTADIIAQVATKKFRIHALALFATSATVTNVYLSTTTDLDVLGNAANPIPLATDADGDNSAGFVMPWNPGGWTETSTANEALTLNLSAAQDVIWAITYSEVS